MAIIKQVKDLLTSKLQPSFINLIDESHLHIGHSGVKESGGKHLALSIVSRQFNQKTRIQRHKLVYQALNGLIGKEIHALRIDAKSELENKSS